MIRRSGSSGLYIHGGENNVTQFWITTEDNGGHGAELVDTKLNSLWFEYVSNNESGIVLDGPDTAFNDLTFDYIGKSPDSESGQLVNKGNRQHGVHIRGGAHENSITGLGIYANGGHGIFIEGAGTDKNRMDEPPEIAQNIGDGIRIAEGAKHNVVHQAPAPGWVRIHSNGGNGITVEGEGTDFNVVEGELYYWDMIYVGDPDPDDASVQPNEGVGILIADGAEGTRVSWVGVGINLGGGIKLADIRKEWGQEEPYDLAVLEHVTVGYYWEPGHGYQPIEEGLVGNGIHLENTTDAWLTKDFVYGQASSVYGHDIGLLISGQASGRNTIEVSIEKSAQQGVLVQDSEGDWLEVSVNRAGSHGVHLSGARNTQLEVSVNGAGSHGVYLSGTRAKSCWVCLP